jgi:hypothetical protein
MGFEKSPDEETRRRGDEEKGKYPCPSVPAFYG